MFERPATLMVTHSQGEAPTAARPSRSWPNKLPAGATERLGALSCFQTGSRHNAERKKEVLSRAKASRDRPTATTSAPTAGPIMPVSCALKLVNELALTR